MENASKALIMAAEILLGIMIISIGVYLFNILGQYSADTTAVIEEAQITQFNEQFYRFYSGSGGSAQECTIHDIVGVAHLANKINLDNGFETEEDASDTSYYIQVDLQIGARTYRHIETMTEADLINLVKENDITYTGSGENTTADTKKFRCQEPGIGEYTRLVNYMKFVEI